MQRVGAVIVQRFDFDGFTVPNRQADTTRLLASNGKARRKEYAHEANEKMRNIDPADAARFGDFRTM